MCTYVMMLMTLHSNFLCDCSRKVHTGRSPEMVQLEQTGYLKKYPLFSEDYIFNLICYSAEASQHTNTGALLRAEYEAWTASVV
jgi:hypothetical protein